MIWPVGYGRRVLDTVDSTNAEAARISHELSGPEWILSRTQTAARGRRGRVWINPPGNFAATVVMRPVEEPAVVALRSFVTSLALYDALVSNGVPKVALALKWPNDVLLNERKIAGILLERFGGSKGGLAIGIGVNLIAAPVVDEVESGAVPPASVLEETGVRVTPEAFLDALAGAYANWETTFVTYGFAPVREAWLARAARIGDTVTARLGQETVIGRFETVDDHGAIIIETGEGQRAIAAADIFF